MTELEQLRVWPCSVKAAKKWIATTHRHLKKVNGGLFAVSLVDGTGVMHAVALAGNGPRVWQGTGRLIITRVAVEEGLPDKDDHANCACSMLYGAMCRAGKALGFVEAWTYTLPEEPGISLRGAGFIDMGLTKGGEHTRPSRHRAPAERPEPKRRWRRILSGTGVLS